MGNLDQGQAVISVARCSGVFSLEELLSVLGTPLEKVSFRHVGKVSSLDTPPCVGYLGHPFLKRGGERSADRSETIATKH